MSDIMEYNTFPLPKYCENCILSLIGNNYEYINYIDADDEGFTFLYIDLMTNMDVILKIKHTNIDSIKYAFTIGQELNKLEKRYLIETLQYLQNDEISILITSKPRGETLEYLLNEFTNGDLNDDDVTRDDIVILFKQIMYIIMELHNVGYTHYNLTTDKIIIDVDYETHIETYECYGKIIEIETKFYVKIIDYEYGHLDGVYHVWCGINNNDIKVGVVPSVFDNLYDLCTFVSGVSGIIGIWEGRSEEIMKDNPLSLVIWPERGIDGMYDADIKYGTNIKLEKFYVNSNGICNGPYDNIINICNGLTEYKKIMVRNRKNNALDLYYAFIDDVLEWKDDI